MMCGMKKKGKADKILLGTAKKVDKKFVKIIKKTKK